MTAHDVYASTTPRINAPASAGMSADVAPVTRSDREANAGADRPLDVEPDDPTDSDAHQSTRRAPLRSGGADSGSVSGGATRQNTPGAVVRGASGEPGNAAHAGHAGHAGHANEAPPPPPGPEQSSSMFRWALDALHQPAMASADWLARDIAPEHQGAVALLTNPEITLTEIRKAKSVFKTMRIVGEKSADRRTGARMYAAAIAAGLVRFNERVSTQSDEALARAFQALLDDRRMPEALRKLAGTALCRLRETGGADGAGVRRGGGPGSGPEPGGSAGGREGAA